MNLSKIILGALIAIGLFIGGVLTGRFYYAKTEIKVKEITVTDTVWKDKCEQLKSELSKFPPKITETEKEKISLDDLNSLVYCYNSSISFEDYTENHTLSVTAFDDCKQATVKYEIGTRGNYRIYLTIGIAGIITGGILYHYLK